MQDQETTITTVFEWRTDRGAVANQFFNEAAARKWHEGRCKESIDPEFYQRLNLYRKDLAITNTKLS